MAQNFFPCQPGFSFLWCCGTATAALARLARRTCCGCGCTGVFCRSKTHFTVFRLVSLTPVVWDVLRARRGITRSPRLQQNNPRWLETRNISEFVRYDAYFSRFGKVGAVMMKNGYCYVEMAEARDAQDAIRRLQDWREWDRTPLEGMPGQNVAPQVLKIYRLLHGVVSVPRHRCQLGGIISGTAPTPPNPITVQEPT